MAGRVIGRRFVVIGLDSYVARHRNIAEREPKDCFGETYTAGMGPKQPLIELSAPAR